MPTVVVDYNTANTHELVATVTGKRLQILGYHLSAAGTVVASLDGDNTAVVPMQMIAGVPHVLSPSPSSELVLPAEEAINLVLAGAVRVCGWLSYRVLS